MLSGIGIAVLVLTSVAFLAMTGAAIVNVAVVAFTACRHRRPPARGVAASQSTDAGRNPS